MYGEGFETSPMGFAEPYYQSSSRRLQTSAAAQSHPGLVAHNDLRRMANNLISHTATCGKTRACSQICYKWLQL